MSLLAKPNESEKESNSRSDVRRHLLKFKTIRSLLCSLQQINSFTGDKCILMAQIVKRSFDSNIWKLLCKNIPYRHKNATFISDRRFHSKSTFISRTEATVAADQHQQCGQDERARLKMSAWQIHDYGDIQELQYSENVKIPQILQANECLIKVLASSVNPIDVMMLSE